MRSRRFALSLSLLLLAAGPLVACSHSGDSADVVVTVTSTTTRAPATTAPVSSVVAPPTTSAVTASPVLPTSSPSPSPSSPGTTTSTHPALTCAQSTLRSMTSAQRIGQLLMVGIDAQSLGGSSNNSSTSSMPTLPVGGVFLSGKSTSSAETVLAGIEAIQDSVVRSSGVKAQVAVDQEGGYVQSLRGPDFPAIPTAVEQGEMDTADLSEMTTRWATRLVQAGITLDLAPVADVVPAGTADDNPPIGAQDRQYGSTPSSVGASVTTVVQAMLGAHLGTTVKHFPGLGRVTANTDTSSDAVDDQTTAEDPALQPFRAAIAAGTTAVMISSAMYPQLDPDQPAAFSTKIITGLLRGTLHFRGLVISDDLGSAVAVSSTPAGQRAVDFVTAGGDMVLTVQPADLAPMTAALTAASASSSTFRARVADAALHVLQSKQGLGMLTCGG